MAEESLNGTYTEKWRVTQALTGLDLFIEPEIVVS